ncbi:MAG: DUF5693 family protein [Candidatus Saganbacteria bacterium]|nr:DUF5693 family protein [Candidatus Saganbacteria bacterium]
MKNKIILYLLIAILAIGVAAGAIEGYKRIVVEAKNTSVELAMDLSDIKKISLRDGLPVDAVLRQFKDAGITSIALAEDTLETLELQGKLSWLTGYEQDTLRNISKTYKIKGRLSSYAKSISNPLLKTPKREAKPNPSLSYAITEDMDVLNRIKSQLEIVLGKRNVSLTVPDELEITDDEEDLMELGLGISPQAFKFVIDRGFFVLPRLKNNFRLNGKIVQKKLEILRSEGPFTTVIFDGEEVAGYKNNIPGVAKAIISSGINYGYIEMAEQKGDSELLKYLRTDIIRVHSISEDEMLKKMIKQEAIDRFDRAVNERGVRLLFIRPFYIPDAGKNLTSTNTDYVRSIRTLMLKTSHSIGKADRPGLISLKAPSMVLLTLGLSAGIILLLSVLWQVPLWFILLVLAVSVIKPLAFNAIGGAVFFQKMAALCCAVVFPTLAITSVFKIKQMDKQFFPPFAKAVLMVISVYCISMAGAVLIVGFLADTIFMVGSQQFTGIKLAFILPVLLVAFYCAVIEKDEIKSLKDDLTEWLNSPITVLAVIVAAVLLGVAALYILRSGNFGIGILDTEKLARTFLEKIMLIRPRTKEFLIGYPALFLGAIYFLSGGKKWLWPFLVIGMVAPVSTVNTFCHVHSPLLISLIRSAYGLILGLLFGLIYYCLYLAAKKLIKI